MGFLTGLAASVVEWLLTKVFAVLGKDLAEWQAKRKSDQALSTNKDNLENADKSGDINAIQKADQDALNNIGG